MFEFKDLTTERLNLRKFCYGDLNFVYRHFSDGEVCRYLFDNEPVKTLEEAEEIVLWANDISGSPDHHRWILEVKGYGLPMGTCGFHRWDKRNKIAEIGYDLASGYRKKGYMTEALKAMLGYGFEKMVLNRIEAFVYVGNEDSLSLLEKLGFAKEGIIRDKHLFRGEFYDHYCLSLLKRDFPGSINE